jgi:hypothetical protein
VPDNCRFETILINDIRDCNFFSKLKKKAKTFYQSFYLVLAGGHVSHSSSKLSVKI